MFSRVLHKTVTFAKQGSQILTSGLFASSTPVVLTTDSRQTPELTRSPKQLYHQRSTNHWKTDREKLKALDVGLKPDEFPKRPVIDFHDRVAKAIMVTLRCIRDIFFHKKFVHYAVVLETVGAVPGMVGATLNHLRSLRKMEPDFKVKQLNDEAENERMHLMIFTQLAKPKMWERVFVVVAQVGMMTLYSFLYIVSPITAHRFVAYLEEEAIKSYTEMLESIDQKKVPNLPAPPLAIQYYGLPEDATLRDVVLVVRADEMDHRDDNHVLSDALKFKKDISDT